MKILNQHQKEFLIGIAWSADVIADTERRVASSAKRYKYAVGASAPTFVVAYSWFYFESFQLPFDVTGTQFGLFLLSFICSIIFFSIMLAAVRSSPEVRTFRALVRCMSVVNSALEKPPASRERKLLGNRVLACTRMMQTYRPLLPIRLHKRIIAREATRGSRTLKKLVWPAILGTEEELQQMKVTLARAAIRVGTANWVEVGDLNSEIKDYPVFRSAPAWISSPALIPLAAAAIPLIVALLAHLP